MPSTAWSGMNAGKEHTSATNMPPAQTLKVATTAPVMQTTQGMALIVNVSSYCYFFSVLAVDTVYTEHFSLGIVEC